MKPSCKSCKERMTHLVNDPNLYWCKWCGTVYKEDTHFSPGWMVPDTVERGTLLNREGVLIK